MHMRSHTFCCAHVPSSKQDAIRDNVGAAGGGGGLVIGPTSGQLAEMAAGGSMAFAMMPARGEVTQLSHVGVWDTEDYQVSCCMPHASCRAFIASHRALVDGGGALTFR